jgi:hypothetical protein
MKIAARKVVVANPAKVVKDVSDELLSWKAEGTKIYQQLARDCQDSLFPCEPLTQATAERLKLVHATKAFQPWSAKKEER